MQKVYVFFAPGFEEIEALTVVDILRRANVETEMVSITGDYDVLGAHGINVRTDKLFDEIESADMLVLPGGMPGTRNLQAYSPLEKMLREYVSNDKYIAAICAAPTVFGAFGFLEGKNACCYPGMENELLGANANTKKVTVDGKIITSRGMGTAIDFALKIVELLLDEETAAKLRKAIVAD